MNKRIRRKLQHRIATWRGRSLEYSRPLTADELRRVLAWLRRRGR